MELEFMIRIAVAADLHLPDRSDTQKEAVWQWLLRYLRQEKVDIFVGAGDLTSIGTVCAAERIMTGLRQLGIPYILTPGNSEMRTPEQMPQVLQPHTKRGL
jgi:3',5'-cyclic AMP phosphodiesterase CpdA